MSTEQFIAYQWYLAGAFLAFIFAICTLFFQALFHEKRIALAWLLVIFVISMLNGSGVVSMEILGTSTADDNPVISGISGIGDYLVLGLGLIEVGLFLLFVARHYRKVYVSVPAIVLVICVSFGYHAYQDLMSSGNLMFESDIEQMELEGAAPETSGAPAE
ncbi:MAG: hypothetical protein R3204_05620 [Oceanospirillum sp.]|nr:hypothetical protein [Oceanospirillum sp.]